MARDATNADVQRRTAIAYAYLANAKLDLHDPGAAMDDYGAAITLLQGLVSADPANVRFRTAIGGHRRAAAAYLTDRGATVMAAICAADASR